MPPSALPATRFCSQATGHVRRFFFVDDTLSTPDGGAPKAVVYPSAVTLEITIRADQRNHITPPVLTITWVANGIGAHGLGLPTQQ